MVTRVERFLERRILRHHPRTSMDNDHPARSGDLLCHSASDYLRQAGPQSETLACSSDDAGRLADPSRSFHTTSSISLRAG
jgi:hypothetical protein